MTDAGDDDHSAARDPEVGGSDLVDSLRMSDDMGRDRRSARMGFSVGLALSVGFVEYFAIQPEFLYSSLGGRYQYTYSGIEVDGVQSAGVFEIPLYLKPRIPVGGASGRQGGGNGASGGGAPGAIYALLGPSVALFVTDITTKEEGGGLEVEVDQAPDNTAVLALSGGLGYEQVAGPGLFSVDLHYSISLTEIFDDVEFNLSALTVMLGYAFDLTGGG